MGCRYSKRAWLLAIGIGSGCGDGLVEVNDTDGTDASTGTSDGPTTDPTIQPTTTTATTTTDETTDPSDTTPTTDETTDPSDTDPSDTDPSDTDPTTTETSDSDTDPSTSTDSSDSDSETTEAVSDTDETDSDSDSESESETDPSMAFIIDPDAGGVSLECSVWQQDCPEGEKCMPWANDGGNAWNATRCSPLDPNPGQIGDVCTVEGSGVSGIDSCDIGVMCWNVDPETNMGECVGMCQGSEQNPACEDPQASCAILFEGVLTLCLPNCDPLIQDCGGNQVCIYVADAFSCVPDASGVSGQQNDPCEYLNACDAGLFCTNAELVPNCNDDIGCCTAFCDFSDGASDAACAAAAGNGAACLPFFEEGQAPPGLEDVGACVVPS